MNSPDSNPFERYEIKIAFIKRKVLSQSSNNTKRRFIGRKILITFEIRIIFTKCISMWTNNF